MTKSYYYKVKSELTGLLLSLLLLLPFLYSQAQDPSFHWVKQFYGPAKEKPMAVTTDREGNIISVGVFKQGELDIDPGPDVHTLSSYFNYSAYLVKQDPAGNLLWALKAGCYFCRCETYQVSCDPEGNIYYSGRFSSVVDFDPGFGVLNLSSLAFDTVAKDVFIVKLDKNGNFIWARSFGALFSYIKSYNLQVDRFENVYLSGVFTGTIDFNPGSGIDTLVSSKGTGFLVKLNEAGNYVRSTQLRGNTDYVPMKGALDKYGNVYLAGAFSYTVDFAPGDSLFNMTAVTARDEYLVKLDSSLQFKWAWQWANNHNTSDFFIAVDSNGFVYKSGIFSGTVDFNPTQFQFKLTSYGPTNIYYLRLNPGGYLDWVKQIGRGFEKPKKIWTDSKGDLYSIGSFFELLEFDPGPGQTNVILYSTLPGWGTYISRVDKYGKFKWAQLPGEGVENIDLVSAWTDIHGNVISTGSFMGTVDFDPGLSSSSLVADSMDIFVQKLYQCPPANAALDIDACFSFTLNNHIYTESGTYRQFMTSIDGCDSLMTLNLTIHTVDAGVHLSGITLIANDTVNNTGYQWVDCNNSFAPIPDATEFSFTPAVNGHYALIATAEGCSDTSSCYPITTVGMDEAVHHHTIRLFPNPTSGRFTIQSGNECPFIDISITDIYGKLLFSRHLKHSECHDLLVDGPSGIYFVRVSQGEDCHVLKLVKTSE